MDLMVLYRQAQEYVYLYMRSLCAILILTWKKEKLKVYSSFPLSFLCFGKGLLQAANGVSYAGIFERGWSTKEVADSEIGDRSSRPVTLYIFRQAVIKQGKGAWNESRRQRE